METGGGDGSETRSVTKKKGKKFTTGITATLIPDFRGKKESNNKFVLEILHKTAVCDA